MGYADAKRDNIRMCNDGWRRGYYPRCVNVNENLSQVLSNI